MNTENTHTLKTLLAYLKERKEKKTSKNVCYALSQLVPHMSKEEYLELLRSIKSHYNVRIWICVGTLVALLVPAVVAPFLVISGKYYIAPEHRQGVALLILVVTFLSAFVPLGVAFSYNWVKTNLILGANLFAIGSKLIEANEV